MTIPRFLFALALVVFEGLPPLAAAKSPRGRRISGIVEKTNASARETEIMRTDTSTPLSFVWSDRTTFVAHRQVVDAAIIKSGSKIEVIYHQPFFGRPFVTKVTLLSALERAP